MTTTASSKSFEIFNRIQPHEYFRRFLDHNVRPDGRLLDRFRKTLITAGAITTADGSAMVRLGGTTVVCGIKAEVSEPHVDRPDEGYLGIDKLPPAPPSNCLSFLPVPNVELSPICSPKFRPGPPSEKAQTASEFLFQLFNK